MGGRGVFSFWNWVTKQSREMQQLPEQSTGSANLQPFSGTEKYRRDWQAQCSDKVNLFISFGTKDLCTENSQRSIFIPNHNRFQETRNVGGSRFYLKGSNSPT